mmetsp:Transcript_17766/g.27468  ORF Transcript_17766/g.27468 Transcript_17766/m.27468 type:complete len:163 (+) Transcript_17766:825-1313(+)
MYSRQLLDREFYKRTKSYASTKKDARALDRFENNMRNGQETRKKARHKEFLNEILQHAKEFNEFHKKRQTQTKRRAVIFKNHFESRMKKENKDRIIEDQKRKQLLRENDFDGWIELIKFEKNERLMEILNATNKYIEELGQKVQVQKTEASKQISGFKRNQA